MSSGGSLDEHYQGWWIASSHFVLNGLVWGDMHPLAWDYGVKWQDNGVECYLPQIDNGLVRDLDLQY
jgi:hypothetical protein